MLKFKYFENLNTFQILNEYCLPKLAGELEKIRNKRKYLLLFWFWRIVQINKKAGDLTYLFIYIWRE